MKSLCTIRSASILRDSSPMCLCSFQWRDVINEMQANVPTLLGLLQGCIQRKSLKRVRKRSYLVQDDGIIGICAAILLRHQNPKMNLIQRIVSILLYSGHAPKLVKNSLL